MFFSISALQNIPSPLPPRSDSTLPLIVGTTTALLALSLITYILRIWVRSRRGAVLGWDDFAISLAMVFAIATWAISTRIEIDTGGRHLWYLSIVQLENTALLGFVFLLLWLWTITLIKVSVCLMLLRIKQGSRPWVIGLWCLTVFLFCIGSAVTITTLTMCRPIRANWDIKYAADPSACLSVDIFIKFTYAYSAVFAVTDVICALLPIAFIRKIHRPVRERIVLSMIMALGLIATICGLMKMRLLKPTLNSNDPVWRGAPSQVWALAEIYIAIIAANIPCLKSLLEAMIRILGVQVASTFGTSRPTQQRQSASHKDYEMEKAEYLAKHDEEMGYHSTVRSIHGTKGDADTLTDEHDKIDTMTSSSSRTKSPRDSKHCYVTHEFEVSYSDKKAEWNNV